MDAKTYKSHSTIFKIDFFGLFRSVFTLLLPARRSPCRCLAAFEWLFTSLRLNINEMTGRLELPNALRTQWIMIGLPMNAHDAIPSKALSEMRKKKAADERKQNWQRRMSDERGADTVLLIFPFSRRVKHFHYSLNFWPSGKISLHQWKQFGNYKLGGADFSSNGMEEKRWLNAGNQGNSRRFI